MCRRLAIPLRLRMSAFHSSPIPPSSLLPLLSPPPISPLQIRDLLAKNPNTRLEMKENPDSGVYVKDLTCFVVKSVPEIRKVLEVGKKNRTVGATLMNQDSSRSHSIYTVTVETSTMGPEVRTHAMRR